MADAPPKKKKKLSKSGEDAAPDEEAAGGGGGSKTIIIAVAVGVLMAAIGVGIGLAAGGMLGGGGDSGDSEEVAEEAEPEEDRHMIYVSVGKLLAALEFNGSTRYIQAEVDIGGYEKSIMDDAQHDMPAIRNKLLLLFSSQDFAKVKTVAGREQLLLDSLEVVNEVMGIDMEKAKDKVEQVYFTAFVIQ